MSEETRDAAPEKEASQIYNVSLRGWITLLIVVTVCLMSFLAREVTEPLYTLAGLAVGYYFGQNKVGSKP